MSDRPGMIPQIFILKAPDGGETVLARTVISNSEERVFVGAILFFHDHGGLHLAWEVVDIASRADADGGGYVVSVEFLGSVE